MSLNNNQLATHLAIASKTAMFLHSTFLMACWFRPEISRQAPIGKHTSLKWLNISTNK